MKKFIAFLLTLVLCIGCFTASRADFDLFSYLTDIESHWAKEYIQNLFDMGIFKGDGGLSRAEDNITRSEFTALVTRALYDVEQEDFKVDFPDVSKNDIFYKNIASAVKNGIIKGDEKGYFNGENSITREEIVIITARVLADKTAYKNADFKDISSKYLYLDELEKVYGLGIISGDENKNFNPYSFALRSECAKMINLMIESYGEKDSATRVIGTAKQYVSDKKSAKTEGTESEENAYRKSIESYAKSVGFTAERTVKNVKTEEFDIKNSLASVTLSYDIEFDAAYLGGETKKRTYKGETVVKMMKRGGEWIVYKTDESLKLKEKVNLTWEIYNNAPSYAAEGVNVVSPTWYEIISDSSFKNSQTVYSNGNTTLKITDKANSGYLDYAKNNGYDVWIAYRNNFNVSDTAKFLNSDSARSEAIRFLIKGLADTKADGINIDFENMNDKNAFTNHVREISVALRRLGLVTSVDINKYDKTGGTWSLCYDRKSLANYADYIFLMAYDQNGSWSKKSGPVAGLDWVEGGINTTLSEVDAEKLVLGVPLYVRIWQEKDGSVVKTSAVSMDYALKTAAENNASVSYDEKIGQNVYRWVKDGYDYTVYMEDEVSVANKTALVQKYALAGVGTWRRGFESSGIWSVIKNGLEN